MASTSHWCAIDSQETSLLPDFAIHMTLSLGYAESVYIFKTLPLELPSGCWSFNLR